MNGMNGVAVLIIGIVILVVAYLTYGRWLAKQWGIDPTRKTPAYEQNDGVDYVPAKAPVLMGHHFSSIAGVGPINGPIQAAVFGWVPVLLWVLIGGIFFGAVHDFDALFASIRHKGQSIGEVIADTMGSKAKKLFIIFSYLTLLLVVAAFASIVANTFMATYTPDGAVDMAASAANATTAMISILFIVIAIVFGLCVYRRNAGLAVSTIVGILAIIACIAIGLHWHPLYLSNTAWMVIVGVYILVASVTLVWILLQPRDYLSSFLLYFMMAIAVIGIIGCGISGHAQMDIPAFAGFKDTLMPTGTSLGYMFPALFVTIACGAISGFHSLVGSGTTAKQLSNEKDAQPIAYGGMLIECALAIISLCAVGFIWANYASGETVTPTVVFATGISKMLGSIPGLAGTENVAYTLLVLTNPLVATLITVVLGITLGLTGYANIWPLFGASNQLLAALGLLAVATWLGKAGKNNKMFYIPMIFMLVVTLTSLVFTLQSNILAISAGGAGLAWCYVRVILAALLIILAIILAVDSIRTMAKQKKLA